MATGQLPVPLLPQVASEVLQAASDDGSDAAQLSRLIHKDPALAARILRISNSAAYRPTMPITSLQQAIARLGLTTLRQVALAVSVQGGVFSLPGFEGELRALWRHSLATALYSKEIARLRRGNGDEAFLCGLLHRIGAPVVLQAAVNLAKPLGVSARSLEGRMALFRVASELAAAAGASIATAWKLPDAVIACMVHHADPAAAGEHAAAAALVFVAAQLAATALSPDGDGNAVTNDHPAYAIAVPSPAEQKQLLDKGPSVRTQIDEMTA
jgi:HD-like signal output (HDOD) protein